jgi:hypothetical protein
MKPRSLVAGYSHPDFLTNSDTPQPRPAWDVPDLHDPCRRPVSGVDQSHGDTGRRIAPPRQFPGGPAAALCRIPHNAYRLVVLVHAEPVVLAVVQDCQVSLRRSEPEPPFTAAARRLNRNRQPKRIDDPPTRRPVSSPPDRGTASGWCPHGLLTPQLSAPQNRWASCPPSCPEQRRLPSPIVGHQSHLEGDCVRRRITVALPCPVRPIRPPSPPGFGSVGRAGSHRRWCGKTCSVKHSGFGRHNGVAPGYR